MRGILVLLVLFGLIGSAQAATTIKGKPACFAKEDYFDLQMMIFKNDIPGFTYMMKSSKCILFKESFQASILEYVENEIKIRVYYDDKASVLWTANDSVRE